MEALDDFELVLPRPKEESKLEAEESAAAALAEADGVVEEDEFELLPPQEVAPAKIQKCDIGNKRKTLFHAPLQLMTDPDASHLPCWQQENPQLRRVPWRPPGHMPRR